MFLLESTYNFEIFYYHLKGCSLGNPNPDHGSNITQNNMHHIRLWVMFIPITWLDQDYYFYEIANIHRNRHAQVCLQKCTKLGSKNWGEWRHGHRNYESYQLLLNLALVIHLDIKIEKYHNIKHVYLCVVSVTRPKICKTQIYIVRYNFYGETVRGSDSSALENA